MRALLLSDLHGNLDALDAFDRQVWRDGAEWDLLIVLGDLVDYGPCPQEIVDWVREHADFVVQGNHDHAMATGADCRSGPGLREASIATREYFRPRLSRDALDFLGRLPTRLSVSLAGRETLAVHATPRDDLYEYLQPGAEPCVWEDVLARVPPCTRRLFLGHTHVAFVRHAGDLTIVNPGSLGQPKDGDPRAAFAVVEDDAISLRRVEYDVDRAVERLARLELDPKLIAQLAGVLRTGRNSPPLAAP